MGDAGRLLTCTSGAGRTRVGPLGATSTGAGGVRYGVVQTTAKTTPAGLTITITRRAAANIRTGRDRRKETKRLLVRKIFQLGGELADPATVVKPANETS